MREKKKDFFVVLGRKATKKMLEFLDEHDDVQYKDLMQFASSFTLNRILKELMEFGLIKGYYVVDDVKEKKEWYEITEKGKKILQCLRELEDILRK